MLAVAQHKRNFNCRKYELEVAQVEKIFVAAGNASTFIPSMKVNATQFGAEIP
jgi:hypothetical protein